MTTCVKMIMDAMGLLRIQEIVSISLFKTINILKLVKAIKAIFAALATAFCIKDITDALELL